MKKERKQTLLWCVLSALGAFAVLMLTFIQNGVMPFGDLNLVRNDGIYQYVPILHEFVNRVKDGGSFLYSWNSGLSGNFYATACYYLINPFNLVALLFPDGKITEAYQTVIILNTMAIAASAAWYVQDRFKKHDLSVIIFSLIYTFCGFYILSFYNTMWLMPLVFLPLIARGIEKLVNGGKPWLYLVSLALSILCNFYLSYMLCLFSVLYFFVCIFSQTVHQRDEAHESLFRVLLKFGGSSLAAGGLCAFSLLPIASTLGSSFMKSVFTFDGDYFFNFLELLRGHLITETIMINDLAQDSVPTVALGSLALLLVPLYMFAKKIPRNERIAHIVLVLALWASLDIPILYNIWHGMSTPAGIPYRFSFIYCFVLSVLAYQVYIHFKELPKAAILVPAVISAAMLVYEKLKVKDGISLHPELGNMLIVSGITVGAAALLLLVYRNVKKRGLQIVSGVLILALTVCELTVSGCVTVKGLKDSEYAPFYETVQGLKKDISYSSDEYSRMDFATGDSTFHKEAEDPQGMTGSLYGFQGVTGFSSLSDYFFSFMQSTMGNSGNMGNAFVYCTQTPIYNTVFGIRYVIDSNGVLSNSPDYTEAASRDGLKVYSPKGYLGLGILCNPDVVNWDGYSMNPLSSQSSLWSAMTGDNENAYEFINPSSMEFNNCTYVTQEEIKAYYPDGGNFFEHNHDGESGEDTDTDSEEGTANIFDMLNVLGGIYAYKMQSADCSVSFTITPQKSQNIHLVMQSGIMDSITVEKIGQPALSYKFRQRQVADIGFCEAGEPITVTFRAEKNKVYEENINSTELLDDSIYFLAAGLNDEVYQNGLNALKENGTFEITEFKDSEIKGSVKANKDCVMLMGMPYDEGWTVTLDGEEVELIEKETHILMFAVPEGEHTLEMRYFPQGLKEGIFVTAATAFVMALVLLLSKMMKIREEEMLKEEAEKNDAVASAADVAEKDTQQTEKSENPDKTDEDKEG